MAGWMRELVTTHLGRVSVLIFNAVTGLTGYAAAADWEVYSPPYVVVRSHEHQRMRRAQQREEEACSREAGLQAQIKHLQEQLSAVKQREEDTRQLAQKTEENLRSEVSRLTTANDALESRLQAYGSDSDRSTLSGPSYAAVASGNTGVKGTMV